MEFKTFARLTTVMLSAALALSTQLVGENAQQPRHARYSIHILPTLGGTLGEAWGINNTGLVTGDSTLPGETGGRAVLWTRAGIADLGTLGGPISLTFTRANNRGQVPGYSTTSSPDPNAEGFCNGLSTFLTCLPFVWEKGVMTALPTLGGINGQALGINNRGEIVGQAEGPDPDPCSPFALQVSAVIWRDGHIQQVLPTLAGSAAVANKINENGDAVGLSGCLTTTFYAVLWRRGTPINLGTLGGVFGNIPFGINDRDQVVGQSDLPGDTVHHAFLWQNGIMADLGSLSTALPTSLANGINNTGELVGFSQDANGDDTSSVAWVWQNGVMTDLNKLIPANSHLFLMEALSINDRGEIAGFGRLANGEHRGFVLTPCNDRRQRCEINGSRAATVPRGVRTAPENSGWTRWYRSFMRSR